MSEITKETMQDLGILSDVVYDNVKVGDIIDKEYLPKTALINGGYEVIDTADNDINGFQAMLVQNKSTLEYTFVFRGSESTSITEFVKDFNVKIKNNK